MKCLIVFVTAFSLCKAVTIVGVERKNLIKDHEWSWSCVNNQCVKTDGTNSDTVSNEVCMLTCNRGTLWPLPTGDLTYSDTLVPVNVNSISVEGIPSSPTVKSLGSKVEELVRVSGKLFNSRLASLMEKSSSDVTYSLSVYLHLKDSEKYVLTQDTNEDYALQVTRDKNGKLNATIEADNYFGARHGLETLSQLIVYDPVTENIVAPSEVRITDSPKYKHRGLLLDTARNYISVPVIKSTIDAMAVNKLNTFHWHLTDSQSFPFVSESNPLLSKYGAYSPKKVYTKENIESVIEYARVRGVRVIGEFDAPAHVGEGWQWVGEDAVLCFKAEPWQSYCVEPPCGQLNPTSEKMYSVLTGIYKDIADAFETDVFHMGGDEVNINCWNSSAPLVEAMAKQNLGRSDEDFHTLWSGFQKRAHDIFEKVSNKSVTVILWTSSLTKGHIEKYLDKSKYIIQIWTTGADKEIADLVNKGYRVIFSNYDALYFDCGFGAWVGTGNNWCSPYIPWQKVYDNDPEQLLSKLGVDVSANRHLILGSEVALWTEQADDASVPNRLWPRAAAHAERTWGTKGTWKEAEDRLVYHRERMVQLGLNPDTLKPQWCLQNEGSCYIN